MKLNDILAEGFSEDSPITKAFYAGTTLYADVEDIDQQIRLTQKDLDTLHTALRTRDEDGGISQVRSDGVRVYSKHDEDSLDTLKTDIKTNGIRKPISLSVNRHGEIDIIDGTHRFLMAKELGIKTVPISVTPNFIDYGDEHSIPSLRTTA